MILEGLYHWSPAERFDQISEQGLRPFRRPTVCGGELGAPYVCLGFSPSGAWALSGDFQDESEHVEWDLWEVSLAQNFHVAIRPEFGPRLQEVKVYAPIPADLLWYVGRRHVPCFGGPRQ